MTTTFSPAPSRNLPIGYLRMFLTLMVVAHHAVLAYHPYAPPPPASLSAPMIWAAFPVVDTHRAPGVDLFIGFNDTFFMSLMFLVSGLFVWGSLKRKGPVAFIAERAVRLGVPFVISAALLAPLAYYPTYVQTGSHAGFWREWMKIGAWPAGPAWFLWVLLAFGGVAATAFRLWPGWGLALGKLTERLSARPIAFFSALLAVSGLVYLPMAAMFDPTRWVNAGPFWVQISRLLHYAVYFFAGAGLGACGVGRGLLSRDGKLARRWPLWAGASLAAFVFAIGVFLAVIGSLAKGGPGPVLSALGSFAFVLSCACSSLACVAVFIRFARNGNRVADSLTANAYGIYILHYFFVSWLQLALVGANLPGALKGLLVFLAAVLLSWGSTAALRRVKAIARVIGAREPERTAEPLTERLAA
jgi:fucose 4-O-acetylase-like acetyltransferase